MYGLAFWINVIELLFFREKLKIILKHFELTHTWANSHHCKKLRRLAHKYLSFFVLLSIVELTGNIELAGIQVRQIFVWLYYIMFQILRVFQFSIAFEMVKLELEQINNDLHHLNKVKYTITHASMRIRLINIRTAYERVYNLSMMINNSNAYSLLSLSILMATSATCTAYWMVLALLKNVKIIDTTVFLCTLLPVCVLMMMVIKPCQDCHNLVRNRIDTYEFFL